MPRDALTGTQKKAVKATIKSAKARDKVALPAYKKGIGKLNDILAGKHMPTADLHTIMKDLKRAGGMAKEYFEPHKQAAIADFQQQTLPQIFGKFGSESGAGSSALNLALSSGAQDLNRNLAADYSNMELGLAQSLLSQRESGKLNKLNAYLSAIGGATGQGINPVMQNLAGQPTYLPSRNGPTSTQRLLGQSIEAAGTIGGAIYGGPPGAAAGNQGAKMFTNQIGWGSNNLG